MVSTMGESGLIMLGLAVLVLLASPAPVHSETCKSQKFTNNKVYQSCNDLPALSSYLHWTYNSTNSSMAIAFIAAPAKSSGWIAWAINPTGQGMVGAQALIAFKQSDGSMAVKTYNISSYRSIVQSKLSFEVWETSAESSEGVTRIFANVAVPGKATTLNHVWQIGSGVSDGMPEKHGFVAANLNSKGTLDLSKGESSTTAANKNGGDSRVKRKNIHGILNAVSWGILFPVGFMIARYLRSFEFGDPAWFYLHVFCQLCAYAIGVAGWATGLKLGSESEGVEYTDHRNIGIALFCLATVQMFALFLRPNKEHKYRLYWNIYHHGVGYSIIILGIINVFKGLDILDPEKKWKSAYILVIAALGVIAVLLEALTWIVVLRRKSGGKSTKPYDGLNG